MNSFWDSLLVQWLNNVFSHPDLPTALSIVARTAILYLFLILGLRLLGKRELGQMSIFDLVLIVLIANAVQNAMVGQDTSLGGGIVAALTLLAMNRTITGIMVRSEGFRHWLVGEPVLIVRDGKLLNRPMKKEGVTREHVMAAMREHGIDQLENVQIGVLEEDGTISIVPKEASVHRTRKHYRGLRAQ